MRRFGSAQQLNKDADSSLGSLNYDSSSPVTNRKQLTSTPVTKFRYVQRCETCCGDDRTRLSSYSPSDFEEKSLSGSFEPKNPAKNVKVNIQCSKTKETREIFVQTPSPLTHRNM